VTSLLLRPVGGRNIRIGVSVCLFVCLSVVIPQKPHVQILPNFLHALLVAVTRSCSDGNTMSYVLPVMWMTSRFLHIMERMGQSQRRRVCLAEFTKWHHRGEVAAHDCMLFIIEMLVQCV